MTPRPIPSHALLVAPLLLLALGCTFGGYVPTEKVAPTSSVARQIVNLELDTKVTSELDCPKGECRLRYRLLVERPGTLKVMVWGPVGEGPESGPRLAQVVLEGPAQGVLGVVYAGDESPLTVEAKVKPGLHFVLIQGLGGHLVYDLSATLAADGSAGVLTDGRPALPPPTRELASSEIPRNQPRGADRPGDTSDGADFAFDPRVDISGMRRFAFAEDPQKELAQKAPPGRTNPFVERQVQREVRYYLANMGFSQVAREDAQLLFSVHVGSRASTWYSMGPILVDRSYDSYFQQWGGLGATVQQHTYVDGTLVVDVIDTRTGDMVWHGWTTEPIALGENQDEVIKQAVKSVLGQIVR